MKVFVIGANGILAGWSANNYENGEEVVAGIHKPEQASFFEDHNIKTAHESTWKARRTEVTWDLWRGHLVLGLAVDWWWYDATGWSGWAVKSMQ